VRDVQPASGTDDVNDDHVRRIPRDISMTMDGVEVPVSVESRDSDRFTVARNRRLRRVRRLREARLRDRLLDRRRAPRRRQRGCTDGVLPEPRSRWLAPVRRQAGGGGVVEDAVTARSRAVASVLRTVASLMSWTAAVRQSFLASRTAALVASFVVRPLAV
jgi:hypothetical protein